MAAEFTVSPALSGVLVVRVDRAAFLLEVQKFVDLSPVFKEFSDLQDLQWPKDFEPPYLWTTVREVGEFLAAVCSAVELAKVEILKKADPGGLNGVKFDRSLALQTAVDLLSSGIKFQGLLGGVVNRLWRPVLNVLVSIWVGGKPSDWATVAATILRLVGV